MADSSTTATRTDGPESSQVVEDSAVDTAPALPLTEGSSKSSDEAATASLNKEISSLSEKLREFEEKFAALESLQKKKANDDARSVRSDASSVVSHVSVRDTRNVTTIPEVRKVEWEGFINMIKGNKKTYSVEVLVGSPRFYWQVRRDEMNRNREMEEGASLKALDEDANDGLQRRQQQEMPERIRINSLSLMAIFKDIFQSDIAAIEPAVFLRPYKPFAQHEKKLRTWLKYLEHKWKQKAEELDKMEEERKETGEDARDDADVSGDAKVGEKSQVESTASEPLAAHLDKIPESEEVSAEPLVKGESDATEAASVSSLEKVATRDSEVDGGRPPTEGASKGSEENGREGTPAVETVPGGTKKKDDSEARSDSLKAYRDLKCLMDYLDSEFYPILRKIESDSCEKIYFRDLWHLYRIGTYVYSPYGSSSSKGVKFPALGHPDALENELDSRKTKSRQAIWRIMHVAQGRPNISCSGSDELDRAPAKKINAFKIRAYSIDYDGYTYGPIYDSYEIEPWEGERDITSLDIIPLRFHKEKERVWNQLLEQGKKFVGYTTKAQHRIYTGATLIYHPSGKQCEAVKRSENVDGHVVVDFKEASRNDPKWIMELGIPERLYQNPNETRDDYPIYIWKDEDMMELSTKPYDFIFDDDYIDNDQMKDLTERDGFLSDYQYRFNDRQMDGSSMSENDIVLLPNRVCGYVLQRRIWALLRLDLLRDVVVADAGWNDLKLLKGHKQMVKAQVKMHFADKQAKTANPESRKSDYDLVRGKGQGLIILLHGAPGVGKTSTAECVAEYLGKPLFPITCGDLGVTASEVEYTLNDIFTMAQAWDCVLLLDEADVFLAQRTRTDLKRNAMVSVFLRVLEYYTGILFLTTNRVGSFDEAFKSRIHLHLYYPALNKEQTLQIWKMNMERTMERKKDVMSIDEDEIMKYAEHHFKINKNNNTRWNGRQIRSAFQTAASLAEYEAIEREEERQKQAEEKGEKVQDPAAKSRAKARLQVSHFITVADASLQFDEYLAEATGVTDAERARLDRERADNFRWSASKSREVGNYQTSGMASNGRDTYHAPNPQSFNSRGPQGYGGMDMSGKPPDFRGEQFYPQYNQNQPPQQQGKGGYLAPQHDPYAQDQQKHRSQYEAGGPWQPSAYVRTPEPGNMYAYGPPGSQMGGTSPGSGPGPGPRWAPAQTADEDDD